MEKMIHETITYKVASAVAGLLGGITIAMFWVPKRLRDRGSFIAGAIISGVSSISAMLLTGMIVSVSGFTHDDMDAFLSFAYIVGLLAVAVLGFISNFFREHEDDTVVEVISEIKSDINNINNNREEK